MTQALILNPLTMQLLTLAKKIISLSVEPALTTIHGRDTIDGFINLSLKKQTNSMAQTLQPEIILEPSVLLLNLDQTYSCIITAALPNEQWILLTHLPATYFLQLKAVLDTV